MRSCYVVLSALFLAALVVRADDSHPFQFTPPDEKLLAEANELDRQFENKGLVYHDEQAEAYLGSIGYRLIAGEATPDRVTYKFRILRDPMINAFALPNGSIYVNSGLIAAMENEAELAAVVSHEITHVANRHTYLMNRSLRKKNVAMDVLAVGATAAGYFPGVYTFGYALWLGEQFSEVFMISTMYGYSRNLESEADRNGYNRLIAARYYGDSMAQSFELLDEHLEFEPVEPFWRTHPKLKERIELARKLAAEKNTDHPLAVSTNQYLQAMAGVIRYNITLDLDSRRARTALSRAQKLVDASPRGAADLVLLADSYRALSAKTPHAEGDELSKDGKKIARRQMVKMTAEEQEQALMATPRGKASLEANQAESESLYKQTIAQDPGAAEAYRGLGMLYQDEHRWSDAAGAYRKYLDLAPAQAPDRLRIERRLEASLNGAKNPVGAK